MQRAPVSQSVTGSQALVSLNSHIPLMLPVMMRTTRTLLVMVMVVVVQGASAGAGFLHTPLGRHFFTAFLRTHQVAGANIFVTPETVGQSVPVSVAREVSAEGACSLSVVVVRTAKDVEATLRRNRGEGLSVALLDTPQQAAVFVQVSEASLLSQSAWLVLGAFTAFEELQRKPVLPVDNLVTFASFNTTTTITTTPTPNITTTTTITPAPNTTTTTSTTTTTTNNNNPRVVLFEAYAVRHDLPLVMKRLGEWRGFRREVPMPREDWSERRTNLTGLHLRCVTMPQAPFVYVSKPDEDNNVEITGGFAKDIWDGLQEIHGFTYSCKLPADRNFGIVTGDGKWTGLVGELVEGRADVVVTSLDHNDERAKAVSFLIGLREIGYRLVARRPGLMDQTWTSFTSELVPDAWLGTVAFTLLAPPFLVLCSVVSPFETERVTFKDAYILAIGAFAVQGSWLEVRSMSTRIVFITIFVATLVVYAHYTSALVALLTVTSTSVGFSSLQDLLADGSFRLGFTAGTLLEQEFKNARHSLFQDVWEKLVAPFPGNLVTDDLEGISKVANEKYIYLIEENIFNSKYGELCRVMLVKGSYFTAQTGFALPHDSPLTKIFDAQLFRLRDGGLLSRAWRRWQPVMTHCTAQQVVAINLNHLFTAFLLLLLGIIVSLTLLPCERLHWKTVGKRKAVRTQQMKALHDKGLVPPLPPPDILYHPSSSGELAFARRYRFNTQYSPPIVPSITY
ncbi:glutamate receptor ionotropic, kainate 4-like [Eriocheir sinensis]|uniref:glutamate receptor ionotropic, kainate 4-like n=1 Tax=Eriocheir sinensis TaxID=95602 RepID=UPI0021C695C5|nr:glutamate receptor ionotropic, kainate 4-like [Eriocheir sinensis]